MPESGDTSRQRRNHGSSLFKGRRKALRLRESAAGGAATPSTSPGSSRSPATPDRNPSPESPTPKNPLRDGRGDGNQVARQDRTKGQARWWHRLWGQRTRPAAKEGAAATALRVGHRTGSISPKNPANSSSDRRSIFPKDLAGSSADRRSTAPKDSFNPSGDRGVAKRDRLLPKLSFTRGNNRGTTSTGTPKTLEKPQEGRRQVREQSHWQRRGRDTTPTTRENRHRPELRLTRSTTNTVLPLRSGQASEPQDDRRRTPPGSSAQPPESANKLSRSRRHRRDGRLGQRELPEPQPRSPRPAPRPRSRSAALVLYATRMLILSIGVGVLAGTVLSAWDPATHSFLTGNSSTNQPSTQAMSIAPSPELKIGQEIAALKTAVQPVIQQNPQFNLGAYLQDLDDNSYLDISGSTTFAAASTIKVPVLVAFFQDVDAGKIRLDEKLTLRKELIGQGSGDMQYHPLGTQYTALEVARQMIIISDNTATNLLIARLGGQEVLNDRFRSWGLMATEIKNLLPDLEGTNTTSPKDLAAVMVRVSQGELISLRSRDRMLEIMRQTVNNSLLPQGLGEGATISHKTGDIKSVLGDVGLIDLPNGKRYAIGVVVKRPDNNYQAAEIIRQVSRAAYQHFNRPTSTAAPAQTQSSSPPNTGDTQTPAPQSPPASTDSPGTDSPAPDNTMQATR
ncbi:serine hydrolase [Pantanalinema rosaneae CENA516]|uniref:serine hydrolase n=1 Tax=Pantanalinema rosaneae TaxID=1620701 RepID=UPI003D6FE757